MMIGALHQCERRHSTPYRPKIRRICNRESATQDHVNFHMSCAIGNQIGNLTRKRRKVLRPIQ